MDTLEGLVIAVLALSLFSLVLAIKAYRKAGSVLKASRALAEAEREGKPIKLRKRYIAFTLSFSKPVSRRAFEKTFTEVFARYFGESTLSKASPQLILFLEEEQRGIVRVSHLYRDHAVAVLGLLKSIGDAKCIVIPLRTCGTLKKCREAVEAG